jgi:Ca2+-transporting ATPase
MGANGSEVARTVANVVLEDDNLETMVTAVAQGRTIYGNIRKTLRFLLSTNFSEIQLMFCGVALGLGQPLNPMQLLWINLATDIFPALGLALDPPEPDVLDLPPRDPLEPILRRHDLAAIVRESAVITAGSMASYLYALRRYGPGPQAQTHVFMALTAAQLLHSKSCRSEHYGLFRRGHRPRNAYLDGALAVTLGLQGLAVGAPFLRRILGTTPLGFTDLMVVAAGAVLPLVVNDAAKLGSQPENRQTDASPAESVASTD